MIAQCKAFALLMADPGWTLVLIPGVPLNLKIIMYPYINHNIIYNNLENITHRWKIKENRIYTKSSSYKQCNIYS